LPEVSYPHFSKPWFSYVPKEGRVKRMKSDFLLGFAAADISTRRAPNHWA